MKKIILSIVLIVSIAAKANTSFKVESFPITDSSFDTDRGTWPEAIDWSPIKKECTRYSLEQTIRNGSSISNFIDNCEDDMLKNSKVAPLVAVSRMRFVPQDRTELKIVKLHIGRGEVLQGVLALKKSKRKLPLVIIKAGTFSRGRITSAGKTVFMHYFQESPFHTLYLESTSSDHFMKENKRAFLGGFTEGMHLVETILAMSQSTYKSNFLEYHIGGISLGGNSALFASIYASKLDKSIRPKSVTAICPVVNLDESLTPLFNDAIVGTALVPYFSYFLQDVWSYTSNLSGLFPNLTLDDLDDLDAEQEIDLIKKGSHAYLASLEQGELVTPMLDATEMRQEDFDYYNNYNNFYKMTHLPTYVIHAENDDIVNYRNNLGSLEETLQRNPNPFVTPITLKEGNHCAFNQAYGTENFSTLLREIVLKNSDYKRQEVELDLADVLSKWKTPLFEHPKFPIEKDRVFSQYNFTELTNDNRVELAFRVFNPSKKSQHRVSLDCNEEKYSDANTECFTTIYGHINLAKLGIKQQYTDHDKNMLLRNLNTHAVFKDTDGNEIIGSNKTPATLSLFKWSDDKRVFIK